MVQAQDNGHPSLSTTLTVYCNVLDLNDNSPVFDPMSYSNEIFENVPIGTEVVTVSATDIDSGKFIIFIYVFIKLATTKKTQSKNNLKNSIAKHKVADIPIYIPSKVHI